MRAHQRSKRFLQRRRPVHPLRHVGLHIDPPRVVHVVQVDDQLRMTFAEPSAQQRRAPRIARQLVRNASVVLSGLLASQANAAIAAYRSQGLVLERSFKLDGWVTLSMVAASG